MRGRWFSAQEIDEQMRAVAAGEPVQRRGPADMIPEASVRARVARPALCI
jgi:hypothetical protein